MDSDAAATNLAAVEHEIVGAGCALLLPFTAVRGRIDLVWGGNIEFVLLNATDPWVEIDGERASITSSRCCTSIAPRIDRTSRRAAPQTGTSS